MKKYFIILIFVVLVLSACTTTPNSPEEINENSPEEINENPFVWYSIEPVRCGGNTWDKWRSDSNIRFVRAPTQEEVIILYFNQELEIPLTSEQIKIEIIDDIVCMACDCGTGELVSVYVQLYSRPSLESLGWKMK